MLIVKDKKAVLLRVRDTEKVTTLVPKAKLFTVKGKEFVAVPHRPDVVKVLGNIGIKIPSPIWYYYNWPCFGITPFDAQREAAAFLSSYTRAFNLSELGTGKSLAGLWAYDYLRESKQVNKALIVSPLSTLERTWADELFTHFPHLTYVVVHGSRAKREKLMEQDVDIYIINHDGVEIVEPILAKRPDIDVVMIDEVAQCARNASTGRWRSLNKVVNKHCPRLCWGMSGTPTPNAPTDAWAQCRLVVPENVPPYFNRFRDQVMRQISQFKWVPKDNATEIVTEVMQPAIRFTRDECVDLPPLMYETREVPLTKDQSAAYKEMLAKLHFEAVNGDITAVNEAVKMSKLIQIACGVAYTTDGEEVTIPPTPRLKAVKEIIEDAEGKVIVFVPFVSSVRMVADYLSNDFSVGVIHGGVKKSERDAIFGAFQRGKNPKVIVAQPAAMSHGLTLTAASTIIWYSCVTSNEVFEQANGRINRPGQKMNNFIIMIEGTPVEKRIYARLKTKQKMQGALLDEVKALRIQKQA